MNIGGDRDKEYIADDNYLQDIWLVMVTIYYNLTKLNKSILYYYLTD